MEVIKDWIGNSKAVHTPNVRNDLAEVNDYYATEPKAVELLLEQEEFCQTIWEPACGEGHISKVLQEYGYDVTSTDLIERGYGQGNVDFLLQDRTDMRVDIITNAPYKFAKEFAEHALDVVANGQKVALFVKLTFLEGQNRRALFDKYPPKRVYVSSARLQCGKNGIFDKEHSAVAYIWVVWEKGYTGKTTLCWIN